MIKATKNELYKIFHKKFIYLVLIITVVFTILFGVLDILSNEDESYDNKINMSKHSMEILETNGLTTSSDYAYQKSLVEMYTLLKDRNIDPKSPEAYYIQNTLFSYINQYNLLLVENDIKELIDNAKIEMDKSIKRLDNFDWKELVQERINEEQSQKCTDQKCEEIKKETIRVLEYRINHDIPFTNTNASSYIEEYISLYSQYINIKDSNDELLKYNDLYEKKQLEKQISEMQYMLDHEIYTSSFTNTNTGYEMIDEFSNPNVMIAIVVIVLSATVVSEEFSKGTIKQLLVKPFSRNKIIISKMLAVLITSIAFTFAFNIISTVIKGIFEGDLITIFGNDIVYNFNTKKCIEISYIMESLIAFIYALPMIILLGIFVFALSTITTNAPFALGMGFGAYLSESVFQLLIRRASLISYAPTLNYNLSPYMFGGMNSIKELYLSKAIAVDIVSFIVLFALIIIVFNKKDIKNQ